MKLYENSDSNTDRFRQNNLTFLFYEESEIDSSLMCRLKNSILSEHLFTNDTDKSANETCSLTVSDSRPSGKSMASWAAADVLDDGLSLAGFLIRLSRKPVQKYQPMNLCHLEDFLFQF